MEAAAFEHGAFVFRILPSHFREHRRKNGACEPTGDRDGYDGGREGCMALWHMRGRRGIFESRIYLVAGYTHTDRVGRVGIGLREFQLLHTLVSHETLLLSEYAMTLGTIDILHVESSTTSNLEDSLLALRLHSQS